MKKEFKKYQHLERYETDETEGIDEGEVYVFPKIDGTNGSIWVDEKLQVQAGSRNRQLSLDNDNAGFLKWVKSKKNICLFFTEYSDLTLYGEWLVPHSLKTYRDDTWSNFYVFDVMRNDLYLKYEEYAEILNNYEISYIPPICKIQNPRREKLMELLDKNFYLIKDDSGSGEGIVLKNYDYKNKFGRITWAKIVRNAFKEKHSLQSDVNEVKQKIIVEEKIIDNFLTKSLIEKTYSKIALNGWSSKCIPELLNTCFYELIKEESWNFIKEYKNPKIDYSILARLSSIKIKKVKSNLF